MITVYDVVDKRLCQHAGNDLVGPNSVWIDILNPTPDEDTTVETALGIDIPTRLEMREIEDSNRFYTENGVAYMTGVTLHSSDQPVPMTSAVTFILCGTRLVTVRYAEPRAFPLYAAKAMKGDTGGTNGAGVMAGLIEMLIERQADLVERVQDEVERTAPQIFGQKSVEATKDAAQSSRPRRLDVMLRAVGKQGDITSRAQESFMSLQRVINYALGVVRDRKEEPQIVSRLQSSLGDTMHLMESLRFLSARTTFLLDATLGMISNEQNQIIKLFSVMAVMLMPPTLVASIYGMNFHHMPELDWSYGYPLALCAMVISAVVPYLYFRRKGWM